MANKRRLKEKELARLQILLETAERRGDYVLVFFYDQHIDWLESDHKEIVKLSPEESALWSEANARISRSSSGV